MRPLDPKQLGWNRVFMPGFPIRKTKTADEWPEFGSNGMKSPQCCWTQPRYPWNAEQGMEHHKTWRDASHQLGTSKHGLWHVLAGSGPSVPRAGRQEGGKCGKAPNCPCISANFWVSHGFPLSLHVTECACSLELSPSPTSSQEHCLQLKYRIFEAAPVWGFFLFVLGHLNNSSD